MIYCVETRVIHRHFCRCCFSRNSVWKSKGAGRKRILLWNSHSRSFKVIHFANCNQLPAYKGRGSISPYNIAGLISKVSEEVAIEMAEYCRRPQPHRHLTPPPWGTPANVRIHLIFPKKLESLAYIFVTNSMGLSSFKFVQWAPKDASFLQ